MCCYKINGMCNQCRDFQFSFIQNLLKAFPNATAKVEEALFQDEASSPSSLYPPSPPPESKPSPAELANDLLQQLDNQFKQENILHSWLEEKAELTMFEPMSEVAAPTACPAPPPTEELLREFESVYGAVELTHLTPPQSPPRPATQLLLSYAHQAQSPPLPPLQPLQPPQPQLNYGPYAPFEFEMQAMEELVRQRAESLSSPSSPSSPPCSTSEPSSAPSSPPSSPRSSTTDEEYSRHRHSPYARGDDRRSRKKEQNKNAATRYRQKKKAEIEVLLGEESCLRQRHSEIGTKCADLQREIKYLKGLMRDLFKAKGLIK